MMRRYNMGFNIYLSDMKAALMGLFLLAALPGFSQEKAPSLPVPAGWTKEEFPLPPSFAPAIQYEGVEVLRFAPGWADSTKATYWTYAFTWQIKGAVAPNADTLRQQLIAYYDGLYLANKQTPPAGYGPHFTQARVATDKRSTGDAEAWTAKVYTYNYLTGRQIDLLFRIHLRRGTSGKRTALLFEVSPKPYGDEVWKGFEEILAGFGIEQ